MTNQQNQSQPLSASVPRDLAGRRLDQVLGQLFSDYSRSRLQEWVRLGRVWVNGEPCTVRQRLNGGEQLTVEPLLELDTQWLPQALELDVVHADEHLLIINKPSGLVVHPGAGNPQGTLLNALLHYDPELAALPRAGIVHRLDKNTSGLLVIARSLQSHTHLTRMIAAREVTREYQALIHGHPAKQGDIDQPIGRHPRHRTRMAVCAEDRGKPARTHYQCLTYFRAHSHLMLRLETGRTHQIRVHMSHIGHPIVGDPDYNGRRPAQKNVSQPCREVLDTFPRQALHAKRLAFLHPIREQPMEFDQPLPTDMQVLLQALADDYATT